MNQKLPENKTLPENKQSADQKPSKLSNNLKILLSGNNPFFILTVACVVFALITVSVFKLAVRKGGDALFENYEKTRAEVIDDTRQEYYESSFANAEAQYHVKNIVGIDIENVRQIMNLEVLKVFDTEYILQDKKDNNEGITGWLKVKGTSIFTTDLQAAEFIVDNQREYVLVRVPGPKPSIPSIDYSTDPLILLIDEGKAKNYKFWNDWLDVKLKEASEQMNEEISNNQDYYRSARSSAELMISNLVLACNPQVENLKVEVEFTD